MAGPIRISILADGSRARRELDGVARSGKSMGSILGKAGKAAAVGLGVGLVAAAAAGAKFAQQAAEDEQSAKLLEGQLKRSANATDEQVKSTEKWITAQGKLLGVTDDDLRPALSKLVTATKDVGEAQKLASLAMDVSAATGKDLNTVSTALMKAQNGQVSSLSKLGIQTKNAAGETLTMEQVTRRMSDTFGGAAQQKAGTLQGQLDRLKVELSETGEAIGAKVLPFATKLLPVLVDAARATGEWANTNIVPKLQDLAGWVKTNKDELLGMATGVRDQVLPVLKTTGDVVGSVVTFFVQLPGPIKQFAIEGGLAVLVVGKLNAGMAALKATSFISSIGTAETRMKGLASAAKTAAGAGGLLALAHGASQTDSVLGTLETTAGGALLGFSLGGPVGAAIGAGAGALLGLFSASQKVKDEFKSSIPTVDEYKSSLDSLTGKVTQHTRALILESLAESGALKNITAYGISQREAVSAVLGRAGASEKVRSALQAEAAQAEAYRLTAANLRADVEGDADMSADRANQLLAEADSYDANALAIENTNNEVLKAIGLNKESIAAKRKEIAATTDYSALLGKIPKAAFTKVQADGVIPTSKAIARLAEQYDLSRKEVKALISVTGVETTVRKVQGVREELRKAGEQKANMQPFLVSLTQGIATARGNASRGGNGVGNALGAGVQSGLSGWANRISTLAAGMVTQAVAAANRAGRIKSPSKETEKTGHWLGAGLAKGLAESTPLSAAAAKRLVQGVLGAITHGAEGAAKSIDLVTKAVERSVKLKDDKKEAAREREILASLKGRFAAIREAGKAQDQLNAKIDRERENLRGLIEERKQYAQTVADGVRSYSALTGLLSSEEGALNDAPALLDRLRQRLGDTQEFASLLQSLTAGGLSSALIDQLANAGVEGGLAIAQAIAQGGPAAIAEFNTLQGQIDTIATSVGTSTAASMYNAGIASAQGLLAGLEQESSKLEKWAEKLARKLVNSLKAELGIHSPSTVFRTIGENTVKGLAIGLDDTYVKRSGEVLAESLVKGFGTPALTAAAPIGGNGASGGNTYHITANVPLGTSAAAVGEEIIGKIKAFEKAGGRELATG